MMRFHDVFSNYRFAQTKAAAAFATVITCAATMLVSGPASADVTTVSVEITNNAREGGVHLSPVWVGFHDGSFDLYNRGAASSIQLSRLAEDGNSDPLARTFANNRTLAATDRQQQGSRVQGLLSGTGGAIAPGETVQMSFDIDNSAGGANQFLSYAAKVLPGNDYFVGNSAPQGIDLSAISESGVLLDRGPVIDAGTEANDFATSVGNSLFPSLNLPLGQTVPNEGEDQFGVAAEVLSPFVGFANTPTDADTNADFAALNFNNDNSNNFASIRSIRSIQPGGGGLATISVTEVTAVPEPSTASLIGLLTIGFLTRRRCR